MQQSCSPKCSYTAPCTSPPPALKLLETAENTDTTVGIIPKSRKNVKESGLYLVLLFFPTYLFSFLILEHCPAKRVYHPVGCTLDTLIPFNEWFLIPYLAWHILIPVSVLYTLRHEVPVFRKTMRYFIITYIVTLAVYLAYPTCQELRPETFPRDNLLTWAVHIIYQLDTSTNVCPSMHVIGALGLWFTARECESFSAKPWRVFLFAAVLLICLSTVFIKQHSVIDVVAAVPVSLLGWVLCYRKRNHAYPQTHPRV